jgi:putative copper resistance protein D
MTPAIDLVRAGQDAGVVLLFGCHVFHFAVARLAFAASGRAAGAAGPGTAVRRMLHRLEGAGLILALVTGALWLWLATADMSGTPPADALSHPLLTIVLEQTEFGRITQLRFVLALLLAGLLLARSRAGPGGGLWLDLLGALLSAALLASLAWIGHAGAAAGAARPWRLGADALHLLAAGGWLGALPGLLFVLVRARESFAWRELARRMLPRFSRLGLVSVAALLASGLVNAWYLVGGIDALVGTSYGRLLLVKLGLFGLMLALAAVNRYALTPRILGGDPPAVPALRRLARNTLLEILLGLAVLGVVGVLVGSGPPMHVG